MKSFHGLLDITVSVIATKCYINKFSWVAQMTNFYTIIFHTNIMVSMCLYMCLPTQSDGNHEMVAMYLYKCLLTHRCENHIHRCNEFLDQLVQEFEHHTQQGGWPGVWSNYSLRYILQDMHWECINHCPPKVMGIMREHWGNTAKSSFSATKIQVVHTQGQIQVGRL